MLWELLGKLSVFYPELHPAISVLLLLYMSDVFFRYVAPEYAMTGHLIVKSDVYSYGVVLLELLTGRRPVDMSQSSGQENLVTWVRFPSIPYHLQLFLH